MLNSLVQFVKFLTEKNMSLYDAVSFVLAWHIASMFSSAVVGVIMFLGVYSLLYMLSIVAEVLIDNHEHNNRNGVSTDDR